MTHDLNSIRGAPRERTLFTPHILTAAWLDGGKGSRTAKQVNETITEFRDTRSTRDGREKHN